MEKPSLLARVRAFVIKHWSAVVAALSALGVLLFAVFKARAPEPRPSEDTPTVPSGPTRAAQVHAQGTLERQQELAARATQEAAAQRSAELEAAEKLRTEEERLRRESAAAGASAESANDYADRISKRKEHP